MCNDYWRLFILSDDCFSSRSLNHHKSVNKPKTVFISLNHKTSVNKSKVACSVGVYVPLRLRVRFVARTSVKEAVRHL